MFARLTGLVFATVALFGSAHAAPVIVGTHYEESAVVNCPNAYFCNLIFSSTPSGHLLQLTGLNCSNVANNAQPYVLIFLISSQPNADYALPARQLGLPYTTSVAGSTNFQTMNQQVNFYIGAGRYPIIQSGWNATSSSVNLDCTITGNLVTQ